MLEGGRGAHTSTGHSLALELRVVIMLPLVPSSVRSPREGVARGKIVTDSSSYLCHYAFLSGTAASSQAKTGAQKHGAPVLGRGPVLGRLPAPSLLSQAPSESETRVRALWPQAPAALSGLPGGWTFPSSPSAPSGIQAACAPFQCALPSPPGPSRHLLAAA